MESRLELAARELLALAAAGQEIDLSGLQAALEPDPTPLLVFTDQDPSWVIQAGREGTAGLRVTFAKDGVGLSPLGFPGGFALSYPATYDLRDLLVEKLEAARAYTAGEEGSCFDPADYRDSWDRGIENREAALDCDIEAANRNADLMETLLRPCPACGGKHGGLCPYL